MFIVYCMLQFICARFSFLEYKKCRQCVKRVISSAKEKKQKEKKQKECASDLNDPEHQMKFFI